MDHRRDPFGRRRRHGRPAVTITREAVATGWIDGGAGVASVLS